MGRLFGTDGARGVAKTMDIYSDSDCRGGGVDFDGGEAAEDAEI